MLRIQLGNCAWSLITHHEQCNKATSRSRPSVRWYASTPDHLAKLRLLRYLKSLFRIRRVFAKTPFGLMQLSTEDHIQIEVLLSGGYELKTLERILELTKSGDVFLDVGANIGQYSLAVARKLGSNGQVVAVEPNPEICADLLTNIDLNPDFAKIQVVLAAADEHDSMLGFELPPAENRGVSRESRRSDEFRILSVWSSPL